MKRFIIFSVFIVMSLFMQAANAINRPTISFNGQTYYFAKAYVQTNYNHSPVNLIELYLLEGETSDNFSKSIERFTFLQISDYKASLKSRLSEFKEDNKGLPSEERIEDNKAILNVSFWWPFRPTVVYKNVFVFQQDKVDNRAICYVVTELQFFDANKTTHADLVKQGKSLLLSDKIVKAATELSF